MSKVALRYPEGNDITHTFVVSVKTATNAETPYDLTGHAITFIRKLKKETGDADAANITSTGTVTNATGGILTVPITAAMLTPAGVYWYKCNGVSGGKTITLAYGPLEAIDT